MWYQKVTSRLTEWQNMAEIKALHLVTTHWTPTIKSPDHGVIISHFRTGHNRIIHAPPNCVLPDILLRIC